MSGLEDLLSQIPTSDIASKIGVDEAEVNKAVQLLVPVLVGGLHENAQDPEHASKIESAADNHAASGLLDGGVNVDQVDQDDGQQAIAKIFGGNDAAQVASALAGGGGGNSDLLKQLLPILAPIVLAYIGKQLGQKSAAGQGGGVLRRRAQRRAGQHPRRHGRRQQVAGHRVGQCAGLQGGRHSRRIVGRQEVDRHRPAWAVFVARSRRFLDLTGDRKPRTRR